MKQENQMRRTGIIVGVLFIIATAFLFLGEMFYKSYLDDPNVLNIAAENKPVIILGLMIELICILSMPLIGAFIFPVLQRVNIGLALSYFFFRALEGIILTNVALTNKFALVSMSETHLASQEPALQSAVALIRAQNFWGDTAGILYNLIFILGAVCLYSTLYYARLVPRWISIWGLIAIAILLVLAITGIFITWPPVAALLLVPVAVQEMVMAIWFILRGFDFSRVENGK